MTSANTKQEKSKTTLGYKAARDAYCFYLLSPEHFQTTKELVQGLRNLGIDSANEQNVRRFLEHLQAELESIPSELKVLKTSVRTAREFNELSSKQGVDAQTSMQGKKSYWGLQSGFNKHQQWTSSEALFLNMAKQKFADLMPTNALGALEKDFADAQLKSQHDPAIKAWHQKVVVTGSGLPLLKQNAIAPRVKGIIYQAVQENLQARVQMNHKDDVDEVNCLGLIFKEYKYLLLASYPRKPDNVYTFDLANIKWAELITNGVNGGAISRYQRNDKACPSLEQLHQDMDYYVAKSNFLLCRDEFPSTCEIKFKAASHPLKLLRNAKLSEDQQIIEQEDGTAQVTATCYPTSELLRFFMTWGNFLKLESPSSLVKILETMKHEGPF